MTTQATPPAGPTGDGTRKHIAAGLAFSGICAVRNTEAYLRWMGAQMGFYLNLPAYAGAIFRATRGDQQMGALGGRR